MTSRGLLDWNLHQHKGGMVNGRLGAIYIGRKQVGGFLDWKVTLNLSDGVQGDDMVHKLQSWKVTAGAHWLARLLEIGTDVRLKLCSDAGLAYWEGTGKIASQLTSTLEMLIHVRLEVIGAGELEAKRLSDEG